MTPLTARNKKIAELRRLLRRRSSRLETGRVAIEGPVLLAEALRAGVEVLDVFHEADAVLPADFPHAFEVESGVIEFAATTTSPQPVLSVVPGSAVSTAEWPAKLDGLVCMLADVADPGNAGTLIRSAAAAGAAAVVFAGDAVDPANPKVLRASMGAVFHVPVIVDRSTEASLARLADLGYRTVGTAADAKTTYTEAALDGSVALVLGNEAHGLPANAPVDSWIRIPIDPRVESVNVAVAGSVIMFEAARQAAAATGEKP